jgi:fumarate reductase (CoM/CoB) subunit A
MERTTRDKMSQAIFTEDLEGRGIEGGVLISYKEVPESILKTTCKDEIEFFLSKGLDLREESLPVRPACHFLMGGVKIRDDCSTRIEGLYACGECAGGTHGANRLAGNALVETLVFGYIAGESAAEFSKGQDHMEAEANDFIESLPKNFKEGGETVIESLRELAWNKLGIIREEGGIKDAIKELEGMEKGLRSLPFRDLQQYFELRNMIHVLRCIATAALLRKESRGAQYRRDHPRMDPEWKKSIIIKEDFKTAFEPR